ncbi:MAG: flagellar filament capping protein FliD [Pseudomonadota bacterium]
MVTQITLGNYGVQDGKNVLTGGASQIDTKGLIDGLATAKRAPAVRLETANKLIDSQTTALTKLKTLLSTFQTAADTLRNPSGVDNASKNIFKYRTATLSNNTGTSSNYATIAVQPGAVVQTHTIDSVTTLAVAQKMQSDPLALADSTTVSAVSAGGTLFKPGTIVFKAADGSPAGVSITLNEGDTLQTVANKLNEASGSTGVQASILNISGGSYKLILSTMKTGTVAAAASGIQSDPSGVFTGVPLTVTQPADNAVFSIDGVPVTRASNVISDVLDNVTINLKQTFTGLDTNGKLLMDISPDTKLVANAITQMADAYNAFRLFASTQSQLGDDSTPTETAVLYHDVTMRNLISDVGNEVSRLVQGITGTGALTQLGDIGVTLDNFVGDDTNPATKNILTVDTDKLDSLLLSNFDGVAKLFEYQQTSSNTSFATFKTTNNMSVNAFTVNLTLNDDGTQAATATYVDGGGATQVVALDVSPISGGGYTINGKAGTVFEGSQYVAGSNVALGVPVVANAQLVTIDVKATQGYADRFYNLMDTYINSTDGAVTTSLTNLADSKKRKAEEIAAIDEKIVTFRAQLVQQYATLEASITKANNILQLLDAQSKARDSSG